MILTSNYGLNKPEGTDLVDVDDFNENADIVDAELKNLAEEIETVKKSASDGKELLTDAITGYGGTVSIADSSGVASFEELGAGIDGLMNYGDAIESQVLRGYTFTSRGAKRTGAMKALTDSNITYTADNKTPVVVGDNMFFETNSDGVARCCIRTGAGNAGYVNSNTLVAYPMTNRGAWTGYAPSNGGNIAIPAGYHNGNGYVSGAQAYNAGVAAGAAGKTIIQTGSISVYANGSTYRITFNSASNFCFHLRTGGITDVSANVTMQTTTYVDIVVKAYYGNEGTYTLQWVAW